MKKMNKVMAVLSTAVMTASMSVFNVSAAETEKKSVWYYENDNVTWGEKWAFQYFDDQSLEGYRIEDYSGVILTLPEDVEPTPEYFGIDEIEKVYQYENNTGTYISGNWDWNGTVENGENKYRIKLKSDPDKDFNLSEDVAKKAEIAKQLLTDGKIESAEYSRTIYRHFIDHVAGIQIKLDDETMELTKEDLPDLSNLVKIPFEIDIADIKNADLTPTNKKYISLIEEGTADKSIFQGIYNEETLANLPEICKVLKESNPHITDVIVEFPPFPVSVDLSNQGILATPIYMQGDANKNNKIDIIDAVSIAKYLLHPEEMDEETIKLADINNDGTTDIIDAVEIAKKLLEKNKK